MKKILIVLTAVLLVSALLITGLVLVDTLPELGEEANAPYDIAACAILTAGAICLLAAAIRYHENKLARWFVVVGMACLFLWIPIIRAGSMALARQSVGEYFEDGNEAESSRSTEAEIKTVLKETFTYGEKSSMEISLKENGEIGVIIIPNVLNDSDKDITCLMASLALIELQKMGNFSITGMLSKNADDMLLINTTDFKSNPFNIIPIALEQFASTGNESERQALLEANAVRCLEWQAKVKEYIDKSLELH
jgi:hypothetical protein